MAREYVGTSNNGGVVVVLIVVGVLLVFAALADTRRRGLPLPCVCLDDKKVSLVGGAVANANTWQADSRNKDDSSDQTEIQQPPL